MNDDSNLLVMLKAFLERSGRHLSLRVRDGAWVASIDGLPGTEVAGADCLGCASRCVLSFVLKDWKPRNENQA